MVEIGPRAEEARRIASLPMEDRVCEIIKLLKASSSRQAVLEDGIEVIDIAHRVDDKVFSFFGLLDEAPVIVRTVDGPETLGRGWFIVPKEMHDRALATTPPAEGETK